MTMGGSGDAGAPLCVAEGVAKAREIVGIEPTYFLLCTRGYVCVGKATFRAGNRAEDAGGESSSEGASVHKPAAPQ